jgi:hypothetical protein
MSANIIKYEHEKIYLQELCKLNIIMLFDCMGRKDTA